MKLSVAVVEHIQNLAIQREQGKLTHADEVELFDSIDSMNMGELSCLYALVRIGMGHNQSEYNQLEHEAERLGFRVVEELFELNDLGSALQRGVRILDEKGD